MDEKTGNIIVLCAEGERKSSIRDYISLGFGFYIGWNLARTLKYTLLAMKSIKIKKD